MFERHWDPGEATIVSMKAIRSIGNVGPEGESVKARAYEYLADVRPTGGGEVFRTVIGEPFDERLWRAPSVGDVLPVSIHPKSRKVKFDTPSWKEHKEAEDKASHAHDADFDALRDAAPGTTAPAPPGASGGSRAFADSGREFAEPATEFAQRTAAFSDAVAAIMHAKAVGDQAEVERLTAELKRSASTQPGSQGVLVAGRRRMSAPRIRWSGWRNWRSFATKGF